MRSQTRTLIERVVLVLSATSSVITLVAFTTGVQELSSTAASVRDYLSSLAADTPVIIRWPAQALAWSVWFAIVALYRIAILFGLPLLPALPAVWIAWLWVRLRNSDRDVPLFVGFFVYIVAMEEGTFVLKLPDASRKRFFSKMLCTFCTNVPFFSKKMTAGKEPFSAM